MNYDTYMLYTQTDPAELDAVQLTDALDYITVKVAVLRSEYEADANNSDRYADLQYAVSHHDALYRAQIERQAAAEDAEDDIVDSLMGDYYAAETDSQALTAVQELADLGWEQDEYGEFSKDDDTISLFEDWTVEQLDAEYDRLMHLTLPTVAEQLHMAMIEDELNDLDPFTGCLTDEDVLAVINQAGGPFAY